MYESFFGLRERPFDLVPDPRFLSLAPRHREALSVLRYGLTTPRGLTVLLGDAGTGKTTLIRAALAGLDELDGRFVLLTNPTLTRAEFYESLAREFGMGKEAATSKSRFLQEFEKHLENGFRPERPSALVIDEAQSLSGELLEEIRLLMNIETDTVKLLNVVLAGQPELAGRLNQATLRQLKQRVTLRCRLAPLDLAETASYVAGRLRRAGGSPADIFTKHAVEAVFEASAGIPRTINVLCDNALLGGFAAQVKPVDADIVEEVCRDFDLPAGGPEPDVAARTNGDGRQVTAAVEPILPPAATGSAGPAGRGQSEMFRLYARRRRFSFF